MAWIVSGTPDPTYDGEYIYAGELNGKPYYDIPGATRYLFWCPTTNCWSLDYNRISGIGRYHGYGPELPAFPWSTGAGPCPCLDLESSTPPPLYPQLSSLLVHGMPSPAAISGRPRFSWSYAHAEQLPQFAWHLQLATAQALLDADQPDVANLQEESPLHNTRYPQPFELEPFFATQLRDITIYFWRIRARVEAGDFQPWEEQ